MKDEQKLKSFYPIGFNLTNGLAREAKEFYREHGIVHSKVYLKGMRAFKKELEQG